jgi:anti-sigma regulatory factor (Ser/Thr protein kinase)
MEKREQTPLLIDLIDMLPIPAFHYDLISKKYTENKLSKSLFGKNKLAQLYYNLEQSDFGAWIDGQAYLREPLIAAKVRQENLMHLYHAEKLADTQVLIVFPGAGQKTRNRAEFPQKLPIPHLFHNQHFLFSAQNAMPEIPVPGLISAYSTEKTACYLLAMDDTELASLFSLVFRSLALSPERFSDFFQLLCQFSETLTFESYFGEYAFAFIFIEADRLRIWHHQLHIFTMDTKGIVIPFEKTKGFQDLDTFESCWISNQMDLFQSRLPFRNQQNTYLTADHILHEIQSAGKEVPTILAGIQRLPSEALHPKQLIQQVYPNKKSIHETAKMVENCFLVGTDDKEIAAAAEIVFGEITSNILVHGFKDKTPLPFLLIAEPDGQPVMHIFDYGKEYQYPISIFSQPDPPQSVMDIPEKGRGINIIQQLCTKIDRKRCFALNVSSYYLKKTKIHIKME